MTTATNSSNKRKARTAIGFALLALLGGPLTYKGITWLTQASGFVSASNAEIQSALRGSNCARQLLIGANRSAVEIRVRDLDNVKKRCALIDHQAAAFQGVEAQ